MAQRFTASAHRAEAPMRPVAVTLGDPAGIGPDITLQGWRLRQTHALHPFAVYGDADALRRRAGALGLDVPVVVVDRLDAAMPLFTEALPVVQTGGLRSAHAVGLD